VPLDLPSKSSFVARVELSVPELKKLVVVAAEAAARGPTLSARVLRRLRIRREGDDERERLAVLAHLHSQGLFEVGRFTYGTPRVLTFGPGVPRVEIGAFCSIADGVEILLNGNHRPDWVSTYPFRIQLHMPGMLADGQPTSRGPVKIGSDVWIGREALILSGVSIGHGAVIGARAVVARDVAPYSIVVGNPGRHVRYRFAEDIVEALVRLRWWDWPESRILESIPSLCDANVGEFLRRHDALP
jgi:acetyltransferase-like isoleucine patch superfamily enzyme